ncbi:MAG: cytochrome c biogenesis protein ResB [Puniceicoccales bacterium]
MWATPCAERHRTHDTTHFYDQSLAWFILPFPGGLTLGTLLLINLACSHFRYFKASWRKCGIAVLHFGVLLLIVSGFLTAILQEESQMRLDEGGAPVNFATDFRDQELVLIDTSGENEDLVTAVPFNLLAKRESVDLPNGFTLKVLAAMPNAGVGMRSGLLEQYENFAVQSQQPGAQLSEARFRQVNQTLASLRDPNVVAMEKDGRPLVLKDGLNLQGFAARMDGVVQQQPLTFAEDEANMAAAVVEVIAPNGESLGAWVVSAGFGPMIPVQGFDYEGTRYDLALRFTRHYFPFTLQLEDFKHDRYPGTEIARNFSSDVIIDNPVTGENRPVLIYMNNPLRYGGLTFFQASFANEDTTSILQVVRNPAWTLPYLAVFLVGLGMCIQFSLSLMTFANRQSGKKRASAGRESSAIPSQSTAKGAVS